MFSASDTALKWIGSVRSAVAISAAMHAQGDLPVADVVHGRPVRNTGALANPESLALFADLEELKS